MRQKMAQMARKCRFCPRVSVEEGKEVVGCSELPPVCIDLPLRCRNLSIQLCVLSGTRRDGNILRWSLPAPKLPRGPTSMKRAETSFLT
jgi:hypothetical protein